MPYSIGIILALAVALFARMVGFDRDRAFYPTVLAVIATYYGLFGVMGGSAPALLAESVFVAAFFVLVVLGFKFSVWLIVAGLVAYGVFDFFHAHLITDPGVPVWWPQFCLAFDVTAAAFLAWLLLKRKGAPSG